MTYKISRDGQEFGPYSLSDVQRYVGTGNILLTDLACAEDSTEWLPIAQVIGTIAVPSPQQAPTGYAAASLYPPAPDLNWGIVLLLDCVTCGIFNIAWNLVQALWIKKVQPNTKALTYYFIILAIAAVSIIISVIRTVFVMHARAAGSHAAAPLLTLSVIVTVASLIMNWIVYPFEARTALLQHFNESDPIGLQLSGVMTFFFGSLYFQYHLNRINDLKRTYNTNNPY